MLFIFKIRTSFNVDQQDHIFEVNLTLVATLQLSVLEAYLNGNVEEVPNAIVNMFNIILMEKSGVK